mmetsp:Transcript_28749/g.37733  ORF Transcript_28749/g.37733 Transcript_28749/m.37733 type:complete len:335 (+) Transcript_28749:78-1082(+)
MSSINFPHPTIIVLFIVLTICSFWLRVKTSFQRHDLEISFRNLGKLSVVEKISFIAIVLWGLHNTNALIVQIYCSFEQDYGKIFLYEVLIYTTCKAMDYSIMYFKSQKLQAQPILRLQNSKCLQSFFLVSASMVFFIDVISTSLNTERESINFIDDCVLEYGDFVPSQDTMSQVFTSMYVFFEPCATFSGLYLFIKPFKKCRMFERSVTPAISSTDNANSQLEQGEIDDGAEEAIGVGDTILRHAQLNTLKKLKKTVFWNCIGVCLSQGVVWMVITEYIFARNLSHWLTFHYWVHPFHSYIHILAIHCLFLDFQTLSNTLKKFKQSATISTEEQ